MICVLYIIFITFLIIIDQIMKLSLLQCPQYINIIDVYINISIIPCVTNKGIALSLFNNAHNIGIIIISIICIIYLIYKISHKRMSYILCISGAISNLIDRIIHHHVIDMIQIDFMNHHLFVCNLADIYLTIGFIILLIQELQHLNVSKTQQKMD